MQKPFFSIPRKIYKFLLMLIFFSNPTGYIETILSTSLYSEDQKRICPQKKVCSIYCHHKFSKRINFYYSTEIKTINKTKKLILSLLLSHLDEHEQEIINHDEILLNKLQWHCNIIHNENIIYPTSIIKKEVDQHDIILFGVNHILFGTLYTIIFDLEDYNNDNLLFNINQYNKEFTICLNV